MKLIVYYLLYFLLLLLFLALARPAKAQMLLADRTPGRVVFSDDFTHGFAQWQLAKGLWQFWQAFPDHLLATATYPFTQLSLVPKEQLWEDSWQNYQVDLWFEPLNQVDHHYFCQFALTTDYYSVLDWVPCITQTYQLNPGQVYHLQLQFIGPYTKLSLDESVSIEQFNFTNSDLAKQPKLQADLVNLFADRVKFHQLEVRLLGDFTLPVDLISQTDSRWADDSYDHDQDWAAAYGGQLGIRRWGCALTSLAMIMHYYDLAKMPDGQAVTPASLNTWLLDQEDGYVGEGLLNWLAATRLIKKISDDYSNEDKKLAKLEFSFAAIEGQDYQPAIERLVKSDPVIGNIPGHFLVINGFNNEQDDLMIKDPAFAYQYLSEHQTNLQSVRIFTPSQTDLSYFLLVYPPGLTVTLKNQFNVELAGQQTVDYLTTDNHSASDQATNKKFVQHYFPKPASGNYQLTVALDDQADPSLLADPSFDLYVYDPQAKVTSFKQNELSSADEPQTFQLKYHHNQSVEFSAQPDLITVEADFECLSPLEDAAISLSSWRQLLWELYQSKQIKKGYVYRQLDKLACYAQAGSEANLIRYQQFLNELLIQKASHLTDLAINQLQAVLLEEENLQVSR